MSWFENRLEKEEREERERIKAKRDAEIIVRLVVEGCKALYSLGSMAITAVQDRKTAQLALAAAKDSNEAERLALVEKAAELFEAGRDDEAFTLVDQAEALKAEPKLLN
jgi:hypothetical protein